MEADLHDGAAAGEASGVVRSFDRDRLVYELIRNPKKARVYTAVLVEQPVTRAELAEFIDGPSETTVYNLLRELKQTEYVNENDSSEPYEYTAQPVQALVVDDEGERSVFKITPVFVAIVSASDIRDDIGLFVERHSLGMLAAAYDATTAYLNGEMSQRMAVKRLGLDTYEGLTIMNEVESIIEEMRPHDPALEAQMEGET